MRFPAPRTIALATTAMAAIYWVAMFVGTHIPGRHSMGFSYHDKVMHFLGYAGLAGLLGLALVIRRYLTGRRASWRSLAVVAVVLASYGMVDELTQKLVPGRSADPWDWVADVAGIALALSLVVVLQRLLLRRKTRASAFIDGVPPAHFYPIPRSLPSRSQRSSVR